MKYSNGNFREVVCSGWEEQNHIHPKYAYQKGKAQWEKNGVNVCQYRRSMGIGALANEYRDPI